MGGKKGTAITQCAINSESFGKEEEGRKREEQEGGKEGERQRGEDRESGRAITQCVINSGNSREERTDLTSNRAPPIKRADLSVLNERKTARQQKPPLAKLHMFWDVAICGPCATTPRCPSGI